MKTKDKSISLHLRLSGLMVRTLNIEQRVWGLNPQSDITFKLHKHYIRVPQCGKTCYNNKWTSTGLGLRLETLTLKASQPSPVHVSHLCKLEVVLQLLPL